MNITLDLLREDIEHAVRTALNDDIGSGDITAQLIVADKIDRAEIITREDCVLCGIAWVNEVYRQLGGINYIEWNKRDGDVVSANTSLVTLEGNTRSLLTGERVALNFLQLLSGVATKARNYAELVEGTHIKILDTRKTIPGLRKAQKYAVACGGCHNHRLGLYDAFLIKENHIAACGGIEAAVRRARELAPGKRVEVEVENLAELERAIEAKCDVIMLDNFSLEELALATEKKPPTIRYEISGNVVIERIAELINYTIDYVSTGDLTKNAQAIDLSMRLLT